MSMPAISKHRKVLERVGLIVRGREAQWRPCQIVITDFFVDEAGNRVEPSYYGMSPDWPTETLITVTFAEHDGKTTLTLRQTAGSAPASDRNDAQQGWTESFARLAEMLPAEVHP